MGTRNSNSGYQVLNTIKKVTAREPHVCASCGDVIGAGQKYYRFTGLSPYGYYGSGAICRMCTQLGDWVLARSFGDYKDKPCKKPLDVFQEHYYAADIPGLVKNEKLPCAVGLWLVDRSMVSPAHAERLRAEIQNIVNRGRPQGEFVPCEEIGGSL